MPVTGFLNKPNPGPFGSTVTNFAAVKKAGETLDTAGEKDFTNPAAEEINGATNVWRRLDWQSAFPMSGIRF